MATLAASNYGGKCMTASKETSTVKKKSAAKAKVPRATDRCACRSTRQGRQEGQTNFFIHWGNSGGTLAVDRRGSLPQSRAARVCAGRIDGRRVRGGERNRRATRRCANLSG